MTVKELYDEAEKYGALDYEILMNHNLELVPVYQALITPEMLIGVHLFKNAVILDTSN